MAIDSNYIGATLHGAGSQTAPGSNTIIAVILAASIPAGFYDVEVTYGFGATAEATAVNNVAYNRGGTAIYNPMPLPNGGPNKLYREVFRRVEFNGSQNSIVQNLAAASAGAIYNAQIIMTRVL